VTAARSLPFDVFLEAQKRFLPAGTTAVFIAGRPHPALPALAAGLAAAGLKRRVLLVGDAEAPGLPDGTLWRRIRRPEDLAAGGRA
jgi:hypothetical protein